MCSVHPLFFWRLGGFPPSFNDQQTDRSKFFYIPRRSPILCSCLTSHRSFPSLVIWMLLSLSISPVPPVLWLSLYYCPQHCDWSPVNILSSANASSKPFCRYQLSSQKRKQSHPHSGKLMPLVQNLFISAETYRRHISSNLTGSKW